MFNPIQTLINFLNRNKQFLEKSTVPSLEAIFANLEQEDITDSSRLDLWCSRRSEEGWNFTDKDIVLLNIQSFIIAFQNTELCNRYKYFVMLKNVNYVNTTVTFAFKHEHDIRTFTFHIFDFERIIRGCNEVLGLNIERSTYLQKKVLGTMKENQR